MSVEMNGYTIVKKIGEGSFSEVLKAKRLRNGVVEHVAIKCVKRKMPERSNLTKPEQQKASKTFSCDLSNKSIGQKTNVSIALENKEVFTLKLIKPHPNIIKLHDIFMDPSSLRVCLVTEFMYVSTENLTFD